MTRVALIGALGHGLKHRRAIHQLQLAGRVRLVAVANRRPVPPAADAPLDQVEIYQDYRQMLAGTDSDIVIVCTPPHTHLAVARDVVRAGRDLLIEKPPVLSTAEFTELADLVGRTGVRCQVNFQSLASPAIGVLADAVRRNTLGTVLAIAAAGAWWRSDAYYHRSSWAGVRTLNGQYVGDGALANQFAHALMQCLALAQRTVGPLTPETVEVEWYQVRDIEVEDTACLRITLSGGLRLFLAVTLAATDFIYGDIALHGSRGTARLEFPTDRILLPGNSDWQQVPGRVSLLENLIAHREDPSTALMAPLKATAPFVRILDVLRAAPPPVRIARHHLRPHPDGGGSAIPGAADIVRRAAADAAMFSELGVAWAGPAHCYPLCGRADGAASGPAGGACQDLSDP